MRAAAILTGFLTAATAAAAEPPRVALLGLTAGDGITDKQAQTLEDLLMSALYRTERFNLVGRSDIAGLLGFERQKQMLGCTGDTSCVAEIAGALDVPVVAIASVGRLGPSYVFALKLVSSADARVLARSDVTVAGEAKLAEGVETLATRIAAVCDRKGCTPGSQRGQARATPAQTAKPGAKTAAPAVAAPLPAAAAPEPTAAPKAAVEIPSPPPAPAPAPPAARRGPWWWIAGAVAVAAAGAGTYYALDSRSARQDLEKAFQAPNAGTPAAAERMRSSAIAADGLFAGAAVAAAGGVLLFAWNIP